MAQGGGGGGNGQSLIQQWIKSNYVIKITFLFLMVIGGIFLALSMMSTMTLGGITFFRYYTEQAFVISKILNSIPLYKIWAHNFSADMYLNTYYNAVNEGVMNPRFYLFHLKFCLETLPIFVGSLFFIPIFQPITRFFINYDKQLSWRNLKPVSNPKKELLHIISTEGTDTLKDDEKDIVEIKRMEKYYTVTFTDTLNKDNIEITYQDYYTTCYQLLKNNVYKDFDYAEENKTFIPRLQREVNVEAYIDSYDYEVSKDELFEFYHFVLLFWITKMARNYPMHMYTIKAPIPQEFKKLCKWTYAKNAPGLMQVVMKEDEHKPRMDAKDTNSNIYRRLKKFREYLNMDTQYMEFFLEKTVENKV